MDILGHIEIRELLLETKDFEYDMTIEAAVKTAGWDKASVEKFGKTIGKSPSEKGFFDDCTLKMKGKVNDPEGFCASLKDTYYGDTEWRGKEKK